MKYFVYFISVFIVAFLGTIGGILLQSESKFIFFTEEAGAVLKINEMDLMPPFESDVYEYAPQSVSALTTNVITYGKQVQFFSLDAIKKGEVLNIKIGEKEYTISLRPDSMPDYTVTAFKPVANGLIYISPFEASCRYKGYAYIIDISGKLLYYRTNDSEGGCVSDFKQTALKDGGVVNTFMQQEEPIPPMNYLWGSIIVMDERFRETKRLNMLSYKDFKSPYVDNHESLIIGKNHYILSTYNRTEVYHPKTGEPIRIVELVIEEIKDGQVIFFWRSSDHPQLFDTCLTQERCHFSNKEFSDYLHYNTLLIDPKDNNLIVSLAAQSSLIKIDRQTGEILWTLGGLHDDFGLESSEYFIGQHMPVFVSQDELLLFDNQSKGFSSSENKNFYPRQTTSRIMRIKLDEKNKIAKVNIQNTPYAADTMGGVSLTDNGTFFVSYGSSKKASAAELDDKGNVLWLLKLHAPFYTYRAYKYTDEKDRIKLKKPKVSIILSTYNREKLLSQAMESILTQTYKNFELIVINDGSTDNTAKILKGYAQRDERVIVLTNETNRGLVYSLNRGIEIARGKYIARMDDDDVSIPVRLQVQVDFLEQHPDITVVGSAVPPYTDVMDKDKLNALSLKALEGYEPTSQDLSDAAITTYFNVPIFHPSAMIRRDFLEKNNIRYSDHFPSAEDTPFWHEIILKGGQIAVFPTSFLLRGSSQKKAGYTTEQLNSFHRFLNESLAGIVPQNSFHGWVLHDEICYILKEMKSHIGALPALTEEGINHLAAKHHCSF